ncbi:MAG: hypothetical protein IIZ67_05670 [Bacilli bacterium]|nr:hypothetical protein [Bacilli bacterium]
MKKQYLIEVAITMILLVGVVLFKFLPEYRQEYGSSDSLIYTDLSRLVEIKIDGVDFGYAYNDENKVRAIIFFNNNSTVLYNKNIENLSIDEALTKSLDILYNDKMIRENSIISIIKYQEDNIDYKTIIEKNLTNKINYSYEEQLSSLNTIKERFNISEEDTSRIIYKLVLQSKEVARSAKNNDKTSYKEYTDNVYRQLVKYKDTNNIYTEEKDNHTIDISLIPADEDLTMFPTPNSYFYINEGMVFAYIEIDIEGNIISYCYNGNINNYDEGVCQ